MWHTQMWHTQMWHTQMWHTQMWHTQMWHTQMWQAPSWYLTLLHYRNHGGQVGKVLAGVRVPLGEEGAFSEMLDGLGYNFVDETDNKIYLEFMR